MIRNIFSKVLDVNQKELDKLEKRVKEVGAMLQVASTRDLAIDGHTVMEVLGLSSGPEVGRVLDELMEMVTDNPRLNTRDKLVSIIKEIMK